MSPTSGPGTRLIEDAIDHGPHLAEAGLRGAQHLRDTDEAVRRHCPHHRGRVAQYRVTRAHQASVAPDQRVAVFREGACGRMARQRRPMSRKRFRTWPGASPSTALARCILRVSTRTPWDSDIGFYDRRIDAKAATARDPCPLREVDEPSTQIGDDVPAQCLGNPHNGLRIRYGVDANPYERAIHEVGPHLLLQFVEAPVVQVFQDHYRLLVQYRLAGSEAPASICSGSRLQSLP